MAFASQTSRTIRSGSVVSIGSSQGDISGAEITQLDEDIVPSNIKANRMEGKAAIADELEQWKNRPNIHIAVHYPAAVEQYGTLTNITGRSPALVLLCPTCLLNYVRLFKRQASSTNHKDVQVGLQLLHHESRKKTLRGILDGSYSYSYPRIDGLFKRVKTECLTLVESLLPPSSH